MKQDYHAVFYNERGRKVLADLLKFVNFDSAYFVEDSRRVEYNNGKRAVVAHILKQLDFDLTGAIIKQLEE